MSIGWFLFIVFCILMVTTIVPMYPDIKNYIKVVRARKNNNLPQ